MLATLFSCCRSTRHWVSWDIWKNRLYALRVEELWFCLAGAIQRSCGRVHCHFLMLLHHKILGFGTLLSAR
jgi:hypothetical protein